MDPPWGGPNYKYMYHLRLKLSSYNLIDIINKTIEKCQIKKKNIENKNNLIIYNNWIQYLDNKTNIINDILYKMNNDIFDDYNSYVDAELL